MRFYKIIIFYAVCIILNSCFPSERKKGNLLFFENFNLYLSGEILEVEKSKYGFYIVGIKVDSSNQEIIDPRDSLRGSFLLLKNKDVAVLHDNGDLYSRSFYEKGDRIEIDKRKITLWDKKNILKFKKTEVAVIEERFFSLSEINSMFAKLSKKYNHSH